MSSIILYVFFFSYLSADIVVISDSVTKLVRPPNLHWRINGYQVPRVLMRAKWQSVGESDDILHSLTPALVKAGRDDRKSRKGGSSEAYPVSSVLLML